MANEASDEVHLCSNGVWEFPLSRSEKLQRLLNLFEADADYFASEADTLREEVRTLREENSTLRTRLAEAEGRQSDAGAATVEADVAGGSGTIRGPPELVAATVAALRSTEPLDSCPAVTAAPTDLSLSPASSPESSPSESFFPSLPHTPVRETGTTATDRGSSSKPKLPGLGLDKLSPQVVATPRGATPAVESTPRCFSIRTPPGSTPRVRSIVTPRSFQRGTPRSLQLGTPRSMGRICSIVTPRAGASTALQPRMVPLQQLAEDRMPSDRGQEDGDQVKLAAQLTLSEHGVIATPEEMEAWTCSCLKAEGGGNVEEDEDEESEDSDEDEEDSETEPEWMSFATPDFQSGLVANFEEFWASDCRDDDSMVSPQQESLAVGTELTGETIWQLVGDRMQQEIARALEEAGGVPQRSTLLRRVQAGRSPRRANRRERSDQNSELLRPLSERLGSAMQSAGRLAGEAKAVVSSRAHGRMLSGPADKFRDAGANYESDAFLEVEPKRPEFDTKTKVAQAANAAKTKLLQKMPKGFQRRKKEINLLEMRNE